MKVIFSFDRETHTLWHSDCQKNTHSAPLKEVRYDSDRSLLECTACGARGFYPRGGTGQIEIESTP